MATLDCRTLFLSDLHLGTRVCRADYLLDLLRRVNCDRLVLVGDVFDVWAMRRRIFWDPAQEAVVQQVLSLALHGVEVIYVPGNHDELVRDFVGSEIRGVRIQRELVHWTADGRRFRVSHGDEFDGVVRHNRVAHWLGDFGYNLLLNGSRHLNTIRRHLGHRYWSLSAWLKTRVSGAAREYIRRFEEAAVATARKGGFDGCICGHIHKPNVEQFGDVLYCNDGDWVEHCTALVEDRNGVLSLLHWSDHRGVEASEPNTSAHARIDLETRLAKYPTSGIASQSLTSSGPAGICAAKRPSGTDRCGATYSRRLPERR